MFTCTMLTHIVQHTQSLKIHTVKYMRAKYAYMDDNLSIMSNTRNVHLVVIHAHTMHTQHASNKRH